MKNSIWKKGLTLALAAMVLTTSVSLPADAAAAAPVAETQEAQPGGEAAPAEENTPATQTEQTTPATETAPETADQTDNTVAAVQTSDGTAVQAGTTTDKTTSSDDSSNNTVNEKPNTSVTITPSNANALVLMDVGAQSPKGVPGDVVEVVLPIAVNREYLPSENYTLRNITVPAPDPAPEAAPARVRQPPPGPLTLSTPATPDISTTCPITAPQKYGTNSGFPNLPRRASTP